MGFSSTVFWICSQGKRQSLRKSQKTSSKAALKDTMEQYLHTDKLGQVRHSLSPVVLKDTLIEESFQGR